MASPRRRVAEPIHRLYGSRPAPVTALLKRCCAGSRRPPLPIQPYIVRLIHSSHDERRRSDSPSPCARSESAVQAESEKKEKKSKKRSCTPVPEEHELPAGPAQAPRHIQQRLPACARLRPCCPHTHTTYTSTVRPTDGARRQGSDGHGPPPRPPLFALPSSAAAAEIRRPLLPARGHTVCALPMLSF
ncbi:hypothetical protein CDD83_553 [Cordyceps sp. RAO-2017]|nr:hypothetical protein CDD83_553 [Cordyceps sp. RAO-2017]